MGNAVSRSSKRCVVLGAGPVEDAACLRPLLRPDDCILAADAGLRLAQRLGVRPSAVIADFDSADASSAVAAGDAAGIAADCPVVRLPVHKDDTDTAAAVAYGLRQGCTDFLLLGGIGGRLDHEYANLLLLVQLARRGCRAVLADGCNRVEAVCRSPFVPPPMPGWSLSLFAFGGAVEGLSIRGAEYPLEHYRLLPEDPLCVSNTAGAGCTVSFDSGTLLVYRSRDA